jgi:hypothetical protein
MVGGAVSRNVDIRAGLFLFFPSLPGGFLGDGPLFVTYPLGGQAGALLHTENGEKAGIREAEDAKHLRHTLQAFFFCSLIGCNFNFSLHPYWTGNGQDRDGAEKDHRSTETRRWT